MRTRNLVCLALAVHIASLWFARAGFSQEASPSAVIRLWPTGAPGARPLLQPEEVKNGHVYHVQQPTLSVFLPDSGKTSGTGVIVCPGGGYRVLAFEKEGTNVARWLNSIGVAAFVLKYRLADYGFPAPMQDACRAVRLVRSQAKRWKIAPDRIGILGFSAGGHLASTIGTHFDSLPEAADDSLDGVSCRPDFMILIYPVISLTDSLGHAGSRRSLLGEQPDSSLVLRFCNERHVSPSTPPTFLVHGSDDHTVPVLGSVAFYAALKRAGVPAELHVFAHGPHGFGLGLGFGEVAIWPLLCEHWLRQEGFLPESEGSD